MTKDIRSLFLRLGTVKEIWDAVKQTYSVEQDASKAYQLHCEIMSICQNGESIIFYLGKLQKIWQQLDDIDDCTMECKSDIAKYTAKVNAQCVYVFLAGLDSHLDGVRGRILATIPLPNIQSVYAVVCAEANRQEAMLGSTTEGVALATKKASNSKKDRKCTHCNVTGHTVDTCFQLHGYPDWHPKSKKASQVFSTAKKEDTNLRVNVAITSGFTAQSGTSFTGKSDWIVDSSATDHMTCDRYKLNQLSSKCSMNIITNANGVSSPIVGTGIVSLSPSLTIKDDLQTKEKIGCGRESGRLYYLEDGFQHSRKGQANFKNARDITRDTTVDDGNVELDDSEEL
ncbi:hypothetical protein FEM48_Zijuj11G0095400 [Ziziphus jujuba var. spinosa]|uniref:Retrotransposon gag domain-containing protein n=1 Tax=Ziziphus jujuba var. spinosa TaxID=714518 RepID=A0A978UI63_ZIZJJ|nr:hypothetical protein FEM48_Zijuj11G0095400 [Ziziphus jujuba var. spinosa]